MNEDEGFWHPKRSGYVGFAVAETDPAWSHLAGDPTLGAMPEAPEGTFLAPWAEAFVAVSPATPRLTARALTAATHAADRIHRTRVTCTPLPRRCCA